MKLRKNSVYALLILSIIMVIVSAVITYFNSAEKKESTKLIIHTYQTIQSSTELFSLLKDMETGQRGYVITGDSTFLEPYKDASAKLGSEVDTLKNLVSENTQQSNLLEGKIIAVVNRKSKDLKNSIHIFKTFGRDSASLRVATKIGKAYMDTLRILVGDLDQQQKALLAQHSYTLAKNNRMEDSIRFSAFAIIALTILVALITIIEKQRSNDMLMQELNAANERLEQKVEERTRQLEDANQAKDHFLGIASHDLKVPISGILGLIHLMNLENKSRPISDVEYLSYMEDSCNNMQRLISNLLGINQIERGAIIISKQDIDLNSILSKLDHEFSPLALKKGIQLKIDKLQETIQTDHDALSRILENLLSNAIKFSPAEKSVHLRITKNNSSIKFEIIDQGPGIPIEEIPSLFGKFQKLSNKPTGGEGSTGLGLSIVKELTILLGGEISVSTKLNEGTIFTVVFA